MSKKEEKWKTNAIKLDQIPKKLFRWKPNSFLLKNIYDHAVVYNGIVLETKT